MAHESYCLAGNITAIQAQVIMSAASGLASGAAINADLVADDASRAAHASGHRPVHGEQAWDERYGSRPAIWSGDPNPALVAEVADLPPGTAFDAGAGEGADACWLAARGWKVTGADISSVALQRAAARAEELGLEITWRHTDLARNSVPGTYDLVTAEYLHLPAADLETLFRHLADAVAPGGTLLVVGHDLSDLATTVPRPDPAEMGWTAPRGPCHYPSGQAERSLLIPVRDDHPALRDLAAEALPRRLPGYPERGRDPVPTAPVRPGRRHPLGHQLLVAAGLIDRLSDRSQVRDVLGLRRGGVKLVCPLPEPDGSLLDLAVCSRI